jgi:hypothetical protein
MQNFEKKASCKSIKLLPCAEHINSLRCYNNTINNMHVVNKTSLLLKNIFLCSRLLVCFNFRILDT